MAACYVRAVRTALKGLHLVPGRWLLTQSGQTPAVCRCSRPLHVSSAASLSSSKTEPQRSSSTDNRRAREEEEEEEDEDAEYIPKRKAKNPMVKIGYAWMIGLPTGIISFILAKREVDKNRLKQLKIRQRMQNSNEGDYEGSRYRRHTDVNLDQ
uniref:Si:ch73-71c20.5 n=1 Tax=Seriola lalandi dorsalis TaxID=1841481 RepID=A0A3B4WME8_SERLL